eukprot:ANDGO_04462.mRNA.1 Retinoblastoma-related protein 2
MESKSDLITVFHQVLLELKLEATDSLAVKCKDLLDLLADSFPSLDLSSNTLCRTIVAASVYASIVLEPSNARGLKITDLVLLLNVNMIRLLSNTDVFLIAHLNALQNHIATKHTVSSTGIMYLKYRSLFKALFDRDAVEYKHVDSAGLEDKKHMEPLDRVFSVAWTLFAMMMSPRTTDPVECYVVLLAAWYATLCAFSSIPAIAQLERVRQLLKSPFAQFVTVAPFSLSSSAGPHLSGYERIAAEYLRQSLNMTAMSPNANASESEAAMMVVEDSDAFGTYEKMLRRIGRLDQKTFDESSFMRIPDVLIIAASSSSRHSNAAAVISGQQAQMDGVYSQGSTAAGSTPDSHGPLSPSSTSHSGATQGQVTQRTALLQSGSQIASQNAADGLQTPVRPSRLAVPPQTPVSRTIAERAFLENVIENVPANQVPVELSAFVEQHIKDSTIQEAIKSDLSIQCLHLPLQLRAMSSISAFFCDEGLSEMQFKEKLARINLASSLKWKLLASFVSSERERELLMRSDFIRGVNVICCSLVVHAHRSLDGEFSAMETLKVLMEELGMDAFELIPIIRPVRITLSSFGFSIPHSMEGHLREIEEICLEVLAWKSGSYLLTLVADEAKRSLLDRFFLKSKDPNVIDTNDLLEAGRALPPLLRYFYDRLFVSITLRLKHLVPVFFRSFSISPLQTTILENQLVHLVSHVVIHMPQLLRDRHLDSILLSCIYSVWKLNQLNISFQHVVDVYEDVSRTMHAERPSNETKSINRHVHVPEINSAELRAGEQCTVVVYYNKVFVPQVKEFILQRLPQLAASVTTASNPNSHQTTIPQSPIKVPSDFQRGATVHVSVMSKDSRDKLVSTPNTKRILCADASIESRSPFADLRDQLVGPKRARLDPASSSSVFQRRLSAIGVDTLAAVSRTPSGTMVAPSATHLPHQSSQSHSDGSVSALPQARKNLQFSR